MATEEQTTGSLMQWLYGPTAGTRGGQRLTISNRTVSGLSFKCEKGGATSLPTGDITFTIRKTSDDSIVASKVWGDAAGIVAGEWMEATFDTAVYVNEIVYILLEFTGGDANNRVGQYGASTDVKASEYYLRYLSGAYNEQSTWDATYIYTYDAGGGVSGSPTVTTQACTHTTHQSSRGHGTYSALGDSAVTAYGHCWSTSAEPTTANDSVDNGAAPNLGQFESIITGLIPGTTYYVRAYATNTEGTYYGSDVNITTGSTIKRRHVWVEGEYVHYFSESSGAERRILGTGISTDTSVWDYM